MARGPELTVVDNKIVSLRFIITGEPQGKGRPRTRVINKGGRSYAQVYTDASTRSWEETIGWQVKQQLATWGADPTVDGTLMLPLKGRIMASCRFNMRRPKSLPKRVEYPLVKPDIDNMVKSVYDALKTCNVIRDDSQVTDESNIKRYETDEHPLGIEIELVAWET